MLECKTSLTLMTYFGIFISLTIVYSTSAHSSNDSQISDIDKCNLTHCLENETLSSEDSCRCDSLCWRRRDCCIHVFNPISAPRALNIDVPPNILKAGQKYQCHVFSKTIQLSMIKGYKPPPTSGFSLVSKCSSSEVEEMSEEWHMQKSLCEESVYDNDFSGDPLLIAPVTSYSTNESYKNIYCASCHGDAENITFWKVDAVCRANSAVSNLNEAMTKLNQTGKDKICELQIEPPKTIEPVKCYFQPITNLNSCDKKFVENNPKVGLQMEFLCQVTHSYVMIKKISYFNPYCAACHLGETDVNTVIDPKNKCKQRKISRGRPEFSLTSPTVSFAVLMDIDFSNSKGNIAGLTAKCPTGFTFDAFSKKCRPIVCSKPYVYRRGNCVSDSASSSTTTEPYNANYVSSFTANAVDATKNVERIQRCPKISLDQIEGKINSNGSLTVNGEKLYAKGSFERTENGTFYVCVDFGQNYAHHFSSQTHAYMTLLCTLCSVVALVIKILAFILIPEIRNFPAKMIFCLSISLFVAQLLFLSTLARIPYYFLCASIGVATHYFYLASFCWMNILSYDLWRTFSTCTESRSLSNSETITRRFHCYSMYAWLAPVPIVATSCVFDWTTLLDETSILRPFYGVTACWISTKTALLIYFALPLALLLCANFLFFGCTTVNICVNSRATALVQEKMRSQKNKSSFCGKESKFLIPKLPHHLRFSLYIKLALIMGLTWVIGFAAAYCGQPILWYLFILLNSSQGVYILLAFTPYRKIQCWIQRQMKPKKQGLFAGGIFSGSSGYGPPSHRKLQRSSTRSSQTTTLSFNYSSHNHAKATVVLSNSGSNC